jgi:Tol biopolymer transport system component
VASSRASVTAAIALASIWAAAAPAGAPAREPAPAPARLAFAAGAGIDAVNADGTGRATLLRARANGLATDPSWSPDGTRIAYAAGAELEQTRIWTMRADGTNRRPFTAVPPTEFSFDAAPAWSPDGKRIAFAREVVHGRKVAFSIALKDVAGGRARQLVRVHGPGVGGLTGLAWSPDGSRILFTRAGFDRNEYYRPALMSVASDGSGLHVLKRDASEATFSPDGRHIAYSSVRDKQGPTCSDDGCGYRAELYVADPDGAKARRITRTAGDEQKPAWSPDGRRIAFQSDRNLPGSEHPELYSIAPDGSCMTWLTNGTPDSTAPAWAPGAGNSSDPSGCGAASRPPLIATDLAPFSAFRGGPAYWLGAETPGHLLLSEAFGGRNELDMNYGDCSSYEPARCDRPTRFLVASVCSQSRIAFHLIATSRPFVFHRALIVPPSEGFATYAITGSTIIFMDRNRRPGIERLVREIRPFGATAPPQSLPRAALPRTWWKRLRPVERAFRAHHRDVRATARATGLRPDEVRARLTIARRLRKLGPFGRTPC